MYKRQSFVKELVRGATGKRLINRLPKQSPCRLERWDIQVQTGYTGRRVTNSRFQFLGTQGEYFQVRHGEVQLFFKEGLFWRVVRFELATEKPCSDVVGVCECYGNVSTYPV